MNKDEWPDEKRIDAIGQNGNDGLHYIHHIDKQLEELERQKTRLLESRRELINRGNLNK